MVVTDDYRPHIDGMTRSAIRVSAVLAAALLGAGALGCGVISKAKQAASNVSALSDVADKLGKSGKLTYTAAYKLNDGSTAQVVQQPPNAAYLGTSGRFVLTEASLLWCTTTAGKTTCQRKANTNKVTATVDQSQYLTAVAGGGFISTPMAVGVLTAAAIVPGVKIDESTQKVGGLSSTCLHVTGIPTNDNGPNDVSAKEFTVCVADNGVLTKFTGLGTDGKQAGVTLATFGDKVDANAFKAPAGAKIVDVQSLDTPN
jgi:hypothetical protein